MAILINPFTGQLDIAGGGSSLPTIGGPVVGADPNSVLIVDASGNLQDVPLLDGEIVIGSSTGEPAAGSISGTTDQVTVTPGANSITLSLPQNIATTSSPTFAGLTLTSFSGPVKATAGVLSSSAIDLTSEVTGVLPIANGGTNSSAAPSNGQLLIGNGTDFDLTTLTGTSDQVTVTNGSGTITLALPQSIATTSSPQFANIVLTPAGSLDITAAGGTLAIGTTNADVINIGNSGATVNIQGTTFYQNVTDLVVTDKNIVINSGGSAGSASNAGISVEENAIITAYVDTSADRNSWEFKAPAQTGIVTISPGVSGFTIDQGSHNPVTLGTTNGLSLVGQALSLALSSTSTTGALSDVDWDTFNNKQDLLTLGDITSTDLDVTGGTGAIIGTGVDLTLADVNLDIGTFANATITVNAKGLITAASATAQNNVFQDGTFLIQNSSDTTKQLSFDLSFISTGTTHAIVMPDSVVNLGALTDANIAVSADISGSKILAGVADSAVVTDTNGNIVTTSTTAIEIGYVSGVTSSIQTQLNGKQSTGNYITGLTGDVSASGPGSVAATVNSVGGSSAANINSAELLANAATNLNTASTIVRRDISGNFTAGTITAALTGNASTATSAATLTTPRAINGVDFDGSAPITVTAAAGTLTGTTLNATVTDSSLTSVGTLTNLTVTNPISGSITGNAATVTTNANLTGPVTSVGNATSVTANAITNAMLAQMPTLTIKGNNTGGTANAADLTVAQVNAILPVFTDTLNGLVPLSGGGTTNFLRADGTFAAPVSNAIYTVTNATSQAAASSITISTTVGLQSFRVASSGGAVALSVTLPFGASAPADGTSIRLVGTSDTNTVQITNSDTAKGALVNGNAILAKGCAITFEYMATDDRYLEISRNF